MGELKNSQIPLKIITLIILPNGCLGDFTKLCVYIYYGKNNSELQSQCCLRCCLKKVPNELLLNPLSLRQRVGTAGPQGRCQRQTEKGWCARTVQDAPDGTAPSLQRTSWRLWSSCSCRTSTRTSTPGRGWPRGRCYERSGLRC